MRSRLFLLLAVVVAGAAGCGDGTTDRPSGTFALRARWQLPHGGNGGTNGNAGACPVPTATPSFGLGVDIPVTADTIRIVLNSEGGRCCVDLLRASAQARTLTITEVPQGAASVTVSAFLEALQPGDEGDPLCATLEDVGQACGEPETLTFTSGATDLTVVPGATADVAPEIYSVPFVLSEFARLDENGPPQDLRPAPGGATDSREVRFAVVDARTGTCEPHFFITQGTSRTEADLSLIPCSDSGDTPCSQGRSLAVEGLQVFGQLPDSIQTGPALVTISACNFAGRIVGGGDGNCAEPMGGFEYSFEVLATPTPTAALTTTRTPTVALTTTPTPPPTVEPTTTRTPPPTVEPTATPTPTPTATLTTTPTPTPTATLTTTPTPTPTVEPTPTCTPASELTPGTLVIRPRWQRPQNTRSQRTCPVPTLTPSFGLDVEIPAAADTVQIKVSDPNDEDRSCCVELPRTSAQAVAVTITNQPQRDVIVSVDAFLETLPPGAPPPPLCSTLGDVGQVCGNSDTMTFTSDGVDTTVVAGCTVEVQPEVYSIPFVLVEPGVDLLPAPDTATDSREVRFVVADARSGTCDPYFFINQQAVTTEAAIRPTPCSDLGGIPCSPGGLLGVDGFQVFGQLPNSTQTGPALAIIAACNLNGRSIDNLGQNCAQPFTGFIYGFTFTGLPIPTDTPSPNPPPTPTPTTQSQTS